MAFISKRSVDNSEYMLRALGALWSFWYPDRDSVKGLITARGEAYYQVYLDMLDLVASKCRFNIPIFKREHWYQFIVKESQRDTSVQLMNLYSTTGLIYQNAAKPAYGDKENMQYFSFAIDPSIKEVHAVYNRLITPSLIWMNNEDFVVNGDRGIISFASDPFQDPLVPKRDILDSEGNVVDREMALWFSLSSWDIENVYTQFGYALSVWMKSSTFYKEFVSAIWDMLVLGPTQETLKLAITALTGIPFAEGNETVVRIIDDAPNFKHVETDKNIYTFPYSTIIIAASGAQLVPGQALCISALVIEPELGQDLSSFGIRGFSLTDTFMNPTGIVGPVVFENIETEVVYVGLDPNNKAIVQFGISGFPTDVAQFWQRSHREGLRLNKTLADVLDTRVVKDTPTTPADLPATINPFQFAVDHIFVNNLYLIYLRPGDFPAGVPGVGGLDQLYPYLSPHTTYMIFVEMNPNLDYYTVGDSTASLGFFKGVGMSDTVGTFATDLGCTIRPLPGRCT